MLQFVHNVNVDTSFSTIDITDLCVIIVIIINIFNVA